MYTLASDADKPSRAEQIKSEEQRPRRKSIEFEDPSIVSFTGQQKKPDHTDTSRTSTDQSKTTKPDQSDGGRTSSESSKSSKPDQSDTGGVSPTKNSKRVIMNYFSFRCLLWICLLFDIIFMFLKLESNN